MTGRYGITIPFDGLPLAAHREVFGRLVELGYSDVWTAEVDGSDGFVPLALAAAWEPSLHLGVAVAPVFTRGPALLAQTAAAMNEAAPGRFALGIGASAPAIVEQWNAMAFEQPYARVRDTLRFLRQAFAGERVNGFRLSRPVVDPPPIYLAALRPQMLRLAGREADGVILNWLSPEDVTTALAEVTAAGGGGKAVACRIFVVPTDDLATARKVGRRMITGYLNVQAYAEFHRWLGRGPELEAMWKAWATGDRKAALAAVPDEVVDALIVHGTPAACRATISRYVENGVTVPVLAVTPVGGDLDDALRWVAPAVDEGG